MYDDNQEALAAEYVLGTLSADERRHAETVRQVDTAFAEIVRQWERRLGELNVMLGAVEPPPEAWEKIKSGIETPEPSDDGHSAPSETASPGVMAEPGGEPESIAQVTPESEASSLPSALASRFSASEGDSAAKPEPEAKLNLDAGSAAQSAAAASSLSEFKIEHVKKAFYSARGLLRRRLAALVTGMLAVLLGVFIGRLLFAQAPAPRSAPSRQLVAVLQQAPTLPAFLLTVDAATRTLTVRTVSARPEAGHRYELWLLSPQFPKPRLLGVIGDEEFTQRPLPAGLALDTIETATYEVSFEPGGGAKNDTPTGPILFTGTMVDSLPIRQPQ